MGNMYDDVENSIPGYKYLVELDICINDPLDAFSTDRLCICDTRDECKEEIKKHIDRHIELNGEYGITAKIDNITRLDAIVQWDDKKNDKRWWWTYGIFPIRYVEHKHEENNEQ